MTHATQKQLDRLVKRMDGAERNARRIARSVNGTLGALDMACVELERRLQAVEMALLRRRKV